MRFKADELTNYISRGIAPKYTDIIDGAATVVNQKCIRDYQVNLELARLNDLSKRKVPTEKLVQKYDVLVNSTGVGTLGRVGQFLGNEANLTVDTHVTIVRPDKDVIDPLFFGYLMKSKQSLIESFATGTTGQTELSRDSIKEMEVSFVENREHQQAIGNFLLAIDRKLQLNKATNQTLEQMAQAIFKSWFVDFEPVKAKMNGEQPEGMDAATASLFPAKLVESELGLIPEGWEVKPFSEWVKITKGKNITKKTIVEGGVPVVAGGLKPAYFHNAHNVNGPVITISASGANAGYVNLYFENIWASDCSYISQSSTSMFFLQYVALRYNQKKIFDMQTGAAQPHIYPRDFERLIIVVPNEELCRKLEDVFASFFGTVANNKQQNIELVALRDTLLPKLLSGEIELGTSEELVEAI